jgi:Peptidase family S41
MRVKKLVLSRCLMLFCELIVTETNFLCVTFVLLMMTPPLCGLRSTVKKRKFHISNNTIRRWIIINNNTRSITIVVKKWRNYHVNWGYISALGIIVGPSKTYGKGLVQKITPLPFDNALKYTIAKYYTPSGRCIQSVTYTGTVQSYCTVLRSALRVF